MKTLSYKKAGLLLKTALLLVALGLFSNPSYAWLFSCKDKYRNSVNTAIQYDVDCAKELILNGADLNERGFWIHTSPSWFWLKSPDKKTSLMYAVLEWNKELVSLLIEKNVNPFLTDEFRMTARDYAFEYSSEAGFYDPVTEKIYNMIVEYEAFYAANN